MLSRYAGISSLGCVTRHSTRSTSRPCHTFALSSRTQLQRRWLRASLVAFSVAFVCLGQALADSSHEGDGTDFLGQADKRPLIVDAAGKTARFVRIQLPGSQYLHLDEVEVFGGPDGKSLVSYGQPSLREHVLARYNEGRSVPHRGAAQTSALLKLLRAGHDDVQLSQDDQQRLVTWMDTYAQRRGSFDADQEQRLRELKRNMAGILSAQ